MIVVEQISEAGRIGGQVRPIDNSDYEPERMEKLTGFTRRRRSTNNLIRNFKGSKTKLSIKGRWQHVTALATLSNHLFILLLFASNPNVIKCQQTSSQALTINLTPETDDLYSQEGELKKLQNFSLTNERKQNGAADMFVERKSSEDNDRQSKRASNQVNVQTNEDDSGSAPAYESSKGIQLQQSSNSTAQLQESDGMDSAQTNSLSVSDGIHLDLQLGGAHEDEQLIGNGGAESEPLEILRQVNGQQVENELISANNYLRFGGQSEAEELHFENGTSITTASNRNLNAVLEAQAKLRDTVTQLHYNKTLAFERSNGTSLNGTSFVNDTLPAEKAALISVSVAPTSIVEYLNSRPGNDLLEAADEIQEQTSGETGRRGSGSASDSSLADWGRRKSHSNHKVSGTRPSASPTRSSQPKAANHRLNATAYEDIVTWTPAAGAAAYRAGSGFQPASDVLSNGRGISSLNRTLYAPSVTSLNYTDYSIEYPATPSTNFPRPTELRDKKPASTAQVGEYTANETRHTEFTAVAPPQFAGQSRRLRLKSQPARISLNEPPSRANPQEGASEQYTSEQPMATMKADEEDQEEEQEEQDEQEDAQPQSYLKQSSQATPTYKGRAWRKTRPEEYGTTTDNSIEEQQVVQQQEPMQKSHHRRNRRKFRGRNNTSTSGDSSEVAHWSPTLAPTRTRFMENYQRPQESAPDSNEENNVVVGSRASSSFHEPAKRYQQPKSYQYSPSDSPPVISTFRATNEHETATSYANSSLDNRHSNDGYYSQQTPIYHHPSHHQTQPLIQSASNSQDRPVQTQSWPPQSNRWQQPQQSGFSPALPNFSRPTGSYGPANHYEQYSSTANSSTYQPVQFNSGHRQEPYRGYQQQQQQQVAPAPVPFQQLPPAPAPYRRPENEPYAPSRFNSNPGYQNQALQAQPTGAYENQYAPRPMAPAVAPRPPPQYSGNEQSRPSESTNASWSIVTLPYPQPASNALNYFSSIYQQEPTSNQNSWFNNAEPSSQHSARVSAESNTRFETPPQAPNKPSMQQFEQQMRPSMYSMQAPQLEQPKKDPPEFNQRGVRNAPDNLLTISLKTHSAIGPNQLFWEAAAREVAATQSSPANKVESGKVPVSNGHLPPQHREIPEAVMPMMRRPMSTLRFALNQEPLMSGSHTNGHAFAGQLKTPQLAAAAAALMAESMHNFGELAQLHHAHLNSPHELSYVAPQSFIPLSLDGDQFGGQFMSAAAAMPSSAFVAPNESMRTSADPNQFLKKGQAVISSALPLATPSRVQDPFGWPMGFGSEAAKSLLKVNHVAPPPSYMIPNKVTAAQASALLYPTIIDSESPDSATPIKEDPNVISTADSLSDFSLHHHMMAQHSMVQPQFWAPPMETPRKQANRVKVELSTRAPTSARRQRLWHLLRLFARRKNLESGDTGAANVRQKRSIADFVATLRRPQATKKPESTVPPTRLAVLENSGSERPSSGSSFVPIIDNANLIGNLENDLLAQALFFNSQSPAASDPLATSASMRIVSHTPLNQQASAPESYAPMQSELSFLAPEEGVSLSPPANEPMLDNNKQTSSGRERLKQLSKNLIKSSRKPLNKLMKITNLSGRQQQVANGSQAAASQHQISVAQRLNTMVSPAVMLNHNGNSLENFNQFAAPLQQHWFNQQFQNQLANKHQLIPLANYMSQAMSPYSLLTTTDRPMRSQQRRPNNWPSSNQNASSFEFRLGNARAARADTPSPLARAIGELQLYERSRLMSRLAKPIPMVPPNFGPTLRRTSEQRFSSSQRGNFYPNQFNQSTHNFGRAQFGQQQPEAMSPQQFNQQFRFPLLYSKSNPNITYTDAELYPTQQQNMEISSNELESANKAQSSFEANFEDPNLSQLMASASNAPEEPQAAMMPMSGFGPTAPESAQKPNQVEQTSNSDFSVEQQQQIQNYLNQQQPPQQQLFMQPNQALMLNNLPKPRLPKLMPSINSMASKFRQHLFQTLKLNPLGSRWPNVLGASANYPKYTPNPNFMLPMQSPQQPQVIPLATQQVQQAQVPKQQQAPQQQQQFLASQAQPMETFNFQQSSGKSPIGEQFGQEANQFQRQHHFRLKQPHKLNDFRTLEAQDVEEMGVVDGQPIDESMFGNEKHTSAQDSLQESTRSNEQQMMYFSNQSDAQTNAISSAPSNDVYDQELLNQHTMQGDGSLNGTQDFVSLSNQLPGALRNNAMTDLSNNLLASDGTYIQEEPNKAENSSQSVQREEQQESQTPYPLVRAAVVAQEEAGNRARDEPARNFSSQAEGANITIHHHHVIASETDLEAEQHKNEPSQTGEEQQREGVASDSPELAWQGGSVGDADTESVNNSMANDANTTTLDEHYEPERVQVRLPQLLRPKTRSRISHGGVSSQKSRKLENVEQTNADYQVIKASHVPKFVDFPLANDSSQETTDFYRLTTDPNQRKSSMESSLMGNSGELIALNGESQGDTSEDQQQQLIGQQVYEPDGSSAMYSEQSDPVDHQQVAVEQQQQFVEKRFRNKSSKSRKPPMMMIANNVSLADSSLEYDFKPVTYANQEQPNLSQGGATWPRQQNLAQNKQLFSTFKPQMMLLNSTNDNNNLHLFASNNSEQYVLLDPSGRIPSGSSHASSTDSSVSSGSALASNEQPVVFVSMKPERVIQVNSARRPLKLPKNARVRLASMPPATTPPPSSRVYPEPAPASNSSHHNQFGNEQRASEQTIVKTPFSRPNSTLERQKTTAANSPDNIKNHNFKPTTPLPASVATPSQRNSNSRAPKARIRWQGMGGNKSINAVGAPKPEMVSAETSRHDQAWIVSRMTHQAYADNATSSSPVNATTISTIDISPINSTTTTTTTTSTTQTPLIKHYTNHKQLSSYVDSPSNSSAIASSTEVMISETSSTLPTDTSRLISDAPSSAEARVFTNFGTQASPSPKPSRASSPAGPFNTFKSSARSALMSRRASHAPTTGAPSGPESSAAARTGSTSFRLSSSTSNSSSNLPQPTTTSQAPQLPGPPTVATPPTRPMSAPAARNVSAEKQSALSERPTVFAGATSTDDLALAASGANNATFAPPPANVTSEEATLMQVALSSNLDEPNFRLSQVRNRRQREHPKVPENGSAELRIKLDAKRQEEEPSDDLSSLANARNHSD